MLIHVIGVARVRWMLLPASVDDNVVTCHSAEHPCGASALRGLIVGRALARKVALMLIASGAAHLWIQAHPAVVPESQRKPA